MKQPHIKHTWIDDENHYLKGYPQDELEFVDETWVQIIVRKFRELVKRLKCH